MFLDRKGDDVSIPVQPKLDVSLDWVRKFLKRHPDAKLANPASLESSRNQFATKENFEAYFEKVCALFAENSYHPSMVTNLHTHTHVNIALGLKVLSIQYIAKMLDSQFLRSEPRR